MKQLSQNLAVFILAVSLITACGGGGGSNPAGSAVNTGAGASGSTGSGAGVSTGTNTSTGTAVGGCTDTTTYALGGAPTFVACAIYSGTLYDQAGLKAGCTGTESTSSSTTVHTWTASGCPINQSLICSDNSSSLLEHATYYYNLSAADLSTQRAECQSLSLVVSP